MALDLAKELNKKEEGNLTRDQLLDQFEKKLISSGDALELPLRHIFTDGIYAREITMPAGAILTSMVHKTRHPFVISKGKVKVFDGDSVSEYEAPYTGVTEPNTRRALQVIEETVWTTFHATDKTDIDEIKKDVIQAQVNPLIDESDWKTHNKIVQGKYETINDKTKEIT